MEIAVQIDVVYGTDGQIYGHVYFPGEMESFKTDMPYCYPVCFCTLYFPIGDVFRQF